PARRLRPLWNPEAFQWITSHKTLRWALVLVLLVGGGFAAFATLAPSSKKTSLMIPTVSQMIPDVIAVMPARSFLRFEMVPFEVKVNIKDMPNFAAMKAVVEVYRGGKPVDMVNGRSKLYLKRDNGAGKFFGNW